MILDEMTNTNINIYNSSIDEIRDFIRICFVKNISSCTMLNYMYNNLMLTILNNVQIRSSHINTFVSNLLIVTKYQYSHIIIDYDKEADLVHFFKNLIYVQTKQRIHFNDLNKSQLANDIIIIILKYTLQTKKIIYLPNNARMRTYQVSRRARPWVKIGKYKWARI